MRLVSGVAIGLSFLNLTVRKSKCSNLPFFPSTAKDWNQLLPDMPNITSLTEFRNDLSSLA